MRRILTGVIVVIVLVMLSYPVNAMETVTTFGGGYTVRGLSLNNFDADDDRSDHENYYDSKAIITIENSVGENLSGVLKLEIGEVVWGNGDTGGGLSTDGIIIEVKNLYITYEMDSGAVQLGLMALSTPKGIVLDDDIGAIYFSKDLMEALTLEFAVGKILEGEADVDAERNYEKDVDLFLLQAVYKLTEESSLGCYAGYVDDNAGGTFASDSASILWLGLTSNLELSILNITGDFVLATGQIEGFTASADQGGEDMDIMGYAMDVRGEVDLDFGIGLKLGGICAYSSGDENGESDGDLEYFVTLSPAWKFNEIWSDAMLGEEGYDIHGSGLSDPLGFMGLGIYVFAEPTDCISLLLRVTNMNYIEENEVGDADIGNEIDLVSTYTINENLSLSGIVAALLPGEAYPEKSGDKDDIITEMIWSLVYEF